MTLHGKYRWLSWWGITLVVMFWSAEHVLAGDRDDQSPVQHVKTQHLQPRVVTKQVNVSGRWVAREEIVVMTPLDGVSVSEVLVDIGEHVQKGQVLAHLEGDALKAQLEQARQGVQRSGAELMQAQARVKETFAAFVRARRLQPAGVISHQELDVATATYTTAQAERQRAQASVKQSYALAEETSIRLAHAEVRAPVAGIIIRRQIQTGALVNAQTPLFTLVRDGEVEFMAQIPASALPRLAVGMPAQLTLPSLQLLGHIRQVGAVVNSDNGYGEARIAIARNATPSLRIGAAGSARIDVEQRQRLVLDVRALRYGNVEQSTYVYVIGPDQRVRRVMVSVGWRDSAWAEITSGLMPQDTVVLAGAALLTEGDVVEGITETAPSLNEQTLTTVQPMATSIPL